MPPRKLRIPVTVDTNVFLRSLKASDKRNPNRRILRLWLLERRLQFIVSPEIVREYLNIFDRVVLMNREDVDMWRSRFEQDPRCTMVESTGWSQGSRDPTDNMFLAAARAGKAKHLITNDSDLLELPVELQQKLTFAIHSPRSFLRVTGLG